MIQSQAPAQSKDSITEWLVQWIAKELGLPAVEIETDKSLLELQPELGDRHDAGRRPGGMAGADASPDPGLGLPFDRRHCRLLDGAARHTGGGKLRPATGRYASGGHLGSGPDGAEPMLPLDDMSDQEVTALLNQLIADERAGASL